VAPKLFSHESISREREKSYEINRVLLGAFVLCGALLSAQETTPVSEVVASYPWLHVNSANYDRQITGNSGRAISNNLNKTMGLVAGLGGYANTRTVSMTTYWAYLFGPRFNWRHSCLTPYAHFLFGGAYVWNDPTGLSTSQNAFRYCKFLLDLF
jgi:hypothetical protein